MCNEPVTVISTVNFASTLKLEQIARYFFGHYRMYCLEIKYFIVKCNFSEICSCASTSKDSIDPANMVNMASPWRHNDHNGVSNHQPHGCLLSRLFRRRSRKTSKLRITGLCAGNSPGPVNSHKSHVPHGVSIQSLLSDFDKPNTLAAIMLLPEACNVCHRNLCSLVYRARGDLIQPSGWPDPLISFLFDLCVRNSIYITLNYGGNFDIGWIIRAAVWIDYGLRRFYYNNLSQIKTRIRTSKHLI